MATSKQTSKMGELVRKTAGKVKDTLKGAGEAAHNYGSIYRGWVNTENQIQSKLPDVRKGKGAYTRGRIDRATSEIKK
jgi:hypothetical protein